MNKSTIAVLPLLVSVSTSAITYTAPIKQLQGEGLEDPYNSIHLDKNITTSPCSSTNDVNRFAISDNVHQSFALAALMAGKEVTIMPSGKCNSANIETINFILIKSSK
jgi:hypothetical protein